MNSLICKGLDVGGYSKQVKLRYFKYEKEDYAGVTISFIKIDTYLFRLLS
mgnify:CR=1 FL=1